MISFDVLPRFKPATVMLVLLVYIAIRKATGRRFFQASAVLFTLFKKQLFFERLEEYVRSIGYSQHISSKHSLGISSRKRDGLVRVTLPNIRRVSASVR